MPVYLVTFRNGSTRRVLAPTPSAAREQVRGGVASVNEQGADDPDYRGCHRTLGEHNRAAANAKKNLAAVSKNAKSAYLIVGGGAAGHRTDDEARARELVAKYGGKVRKVAK